MTISKTDLIDEIHKYLKKKRWNISKQLFIDFKDQPMLLEAYIEMFTTDNIHINFHKDFFSKTKGFFQDKINYSYYYQKQHILKDVALSLAIHEFGHKEICPIDASGYASILVGIDKVLSNQQIQIDPHLIQNFFSDILDNTVSIHTDLQGSRMEEGLNFFYFENGEYAPNNTLSDAYSFFVSLNYLLWCSDTARFDLISRYFPPSIFDPNKKEFIKSVRDDLEEVLDDFIGKDKLVDKILARKPLNVKDIGVIQTALSDASDWEFMAETFTRIFLKYHPQSLPPNQIPIPNAQCRKFSSDPQYRKEVTKKFIEKYKESHGKKRSKGTKEQRNQERAKKSKQGSPSQNPYSSRGIGFGGGGSLILKQTTENLDAFYEEISKTIYVQAEDGSAPIDQFPLLWLQRRPRDENTPLKSLDPFKPSINPETKKLDISYKRLPYMIDVPASNQAQGYPDLCFVVDSSGSMGWAPFQESGNYHIVCVGVYAILHFLKEKGLLESISMNIINFSSTTFSSGWVDHFKLDEFKKILFQYQGGGTQLTTRVLEDTEQEHLSKVKNYDGHFLMFLISDGYIANENEIVRVISQIIMNGNKVVYLAIGGTPPMFKKLESVGAMCLAVTNTAMLDSLMLDITKKQFEDKS
jgi:hypothetical protein